jgi:hypothetical protein
MPTRLTCCRPPERADVQSFDYTQSARECDIAMKGGRRALETP